MRIQAKFNFQVTCIKWTMFSLPKSKRGNQGVFIKLLIPSHIIPNYMGLHFSSASERWVSVLEKEEAICFCEGQMAGYVTIYYVVIYRSASPILSPIQLLIIWLFFIVAIPLISIACPNITAVFLKLQSNSKCLDSTTHKNPQQYVLLEFYLSENL